MNYWNQYQDASNFAAESNEILNHRKLKLKHESWWFSSSASTDPHCWRVQQTKQQQVNQFSETSTKPNDPKPKCTSLKWRKTFWVPKPLKITLACTDQKAWFSVSVKVWKSNTLFKICQAPSFERYISWNSFVTVLLVLAQMFPSSDQDTYDWHYRCLKRGSMSGIYLVLSSSKTRRSQVRTGVCFDRYRHTWGRITWQPTLSGNLTMNKNKKPVFWGVENRRKNIFMAVESLMTVLELLLKDFQAGSEAQDKGDSWERFSWVGTFPWQIYTIYLTTKTFQILSG